MKLPSIFSKWERGEEQKATLVSLERRIFEHNLALIDARHQLAALEEKRVYVLQQTAPKLDTPIPPSKGLPNVP